MLFKIQKNGGLAAIGGGIQAFQQAKQQSDAQALRAEAIREGLAQKQQSLDLDAQQFQADLDRINKQQEGNLDVAKFITGQFGSEEEASEFLAGLPVQQQIQAQHARKSFAGMNPEHVHRIAEAGEAGRVAARAEKSKARQAGISAGLGNLVKDQPEMQSAVEDELALAEETGDFSPVQALVEQATKLQTKRDSLKAEVQGMRMVLQTPEAMAYTRRGAKEEIHQALAEVERTMSYDPNNDDAIDAAKQRFYEAVTPDLVREELEGLREAGATDSILQGFSNFQAFMGGEAESDLPVPAEVNRPEGLVRPPTQRGLDLPAGAALDEAKDFAHNILEDLEKGTGRPLDELDPDLVFGLISSGLARDKGLDVDPGDMLNFLSHQGVPQVTPANPGGQESSIEPNTRRNVRKQLSEIGGNLMDTARALGIDPSELRDYVDNPTDSPDKWRINLRPEEAELIKKNKAVLKKGFTDGAFQSPSSGIF